MLTAAEVRNLLFPSSLSSIDPTRWAWPTPSFSPAPSVDWPSSDRDLRFVQIVPDRFWDLAESHPWAQNIVESPILHYVSIVLESLPGAAAKTALEKYAEARDLYKKIVRKLLFSKEKRGERLCIGVYISGQGIASFPRKEFWSTQSGNDTVDTYPFPAVLLRFPESKSLQGSVLFQNETPSFGTSSQPNRLAFANIAPFLLAPENATSTSFPFFGHSGFDQARWISAGQKVNRATVNVVHPLVRRWWIEKVLLYIDEAQKAAREAREEYLRGFSSPSDPFYFSALPSKGSRSLHADWQLDFVWLDNIAPERPLRLGPDSPLGGTNKAHPSNSGYFYQSPTWGKLVNSWVFVAAMLSDLRRVLSSQWNMKVLLNCGTLYNTYIQSYALRYPRLVSQFPFLKPDSVVIENIRDESLKNQVATPIFYEESIAFLKKIKGAFFSYRTQDLSLEETTDGFMFETGIGPEGFLPSSKHPTPPLCLNESVDGEAIHPDEMDRGTNLVHSSLLSLRGQARWLSSMLRAKKPCFFFLPSNSLRAFEVPLYCSFSWVLRDAGHSLFVERVIFDSTSPGGPPLYALFYQLPSFFVAPSPFQSHRDILLLSSRLSLSRLLSSRYPERFPPRPLDGHLLQWLQTRTSLSPLFSNTLFLNLSLWFPSLSTRNPTHPDLLKLGYLFQQRLPFLQVFGSP